MQFLNKYNINQSLILTKMQKFKSLYNRIAMINNSGNPTNLTISLIIMAFISMYNSKDSNVNWKTETDLINNIWDEAADDQYTFTLQDLKDYLTQYIPEYKQ